MTTCLRSACVMSKELGFFDSPRVLVANDGVESYNDIFVKKQVTVAEMM